jgi:hypothetical protein
MNLAYVATSRPRGSGGCRPRRDAMGAALPTKVQNRLYQCSANSGAATPGGFRVVSVVVSFAVVRAGPQRSGQESSP